MNADMSSTMSGYSPILNAERGTLNTKPFKLFKQINADMSSTISGYSPIFNAEHGTLNAEPFKLFKLFKL